MGRKKIQGQKESKTRLYAIWCGIKTRCFNKKYTGYKYYGGRGIKVCDLWLEYEYFKEWALQSGYNDDLQIDRIDNNGDYSPDNCRWVEQKKQNRNTSRNRYFEIDGQKKCMAEWCEYYGINRQVVELRIKSGWDVEEAFRKPVGRYNICFEIDGQKKHLSEWLEQYGINRQAFENRIKYGWDVEKALKKPVKRYKKNIKS